VREVGDEFDLCRITVADLIWKGRWWVGGVMLSGRRWSRSESREKRERLRVGTRSCVEERRVGRGVGE
jgi:hypothetical protein